MSGDLLPDWLASRARSHPRTPAVHCGHAVWTFADLEAHAARSAGALRVLAPGDDDRVALLSGNSPVWVATVHGAVRAGRTLVPLNTRLTVPELSWQLLDSKSSVLLHDETHADLARDAASAAGGIQTSLLANDGPQIEQTVVPVGSTPLALESIQAIVYTSGTTGTPKGAMLPLRSWWWGAAGSALHLGHVRGDKWLAAMPLFHVGGLAILFRSVIGGTPVVLHERFDPERVNRALDRESVTLVSLVSAMAASMMDERSTTYPGQLRVALLGGGPAPAAIVDRARALGLPVAPTYGLTEAASQVTTLLPWEVVIRSGSSGRPLPHVELRIEVNGVECPAGTDGEIVIRSRSLMRGYLGRPPQNDDAWFSTGDVGRLDDDGYLTVLDRRDDLIVSGGENVYPAEVEAALMDHPDVMEAAVVGIEDGRWGSVPIGVVVVRADSRVTDDEILAHTALRLARYKQPRRIVRLEQLPRTATGKVLRRQMRELASR